jgi:CubicO group peptidase (beta-lactamase class C family)
MKIRNFSSLFLLLLMTVSVVVAQDNVKQIDTILKTYYDYGQFNGTVLVAEKGKVIYQKGFGMANMEWSIPNQPDTKFRIGSVTKQFTATLILQLVEQGKVKLDGKLSDYLPYYRKDTGEKVTVHQLLNHTSGIPSYTNAEFFKETSRDPYKPEDFVKKFASGNLEFEPGSKFAYNNSGYFLLGAIIEQVTGKSYEAVLNERIFAPLGMTNTGYDNAAPIIKKRADGYEKTPDGFVNAAYLDMSLPYAAGSMYSTVEDLLKWDQALYGDKILSAESKTKMFTPGLSNYGYGFGIEDRAIGKSDKKIKYIQHGGGINGFNCLFTRLVDKQQTVIVLDNVSLGQYHDKITDSIVSILNGETFDPPKKSIGEQFYKTAMASGVEVAIAEYRKLKAANSSLYDFSENEMNALGYRFLGNKRVKDSIAIFKLNTEMFPQSGNTYDSLGEAYLVDGQKELALENYKKAVALDPTNTNAVAIINRLEGKETKVDPASYDAYVGEYELTPSFILTVFKEGDKLITQATGQGKIPLEPAGEGKFVVTELKASITFEKDADGKVNGLTLVQNGRTMKAKKIK